MRERRELVCPGTNVCCPTCGNPIGLLDIHAGNLFAVCPNKRGHRETRRNCNQHLYVHCTDRLCTVIAISAEEHRRFGDGHYTRAEILRGLGLCHREAA